MIKESISPVCSRPMAETIAGALPTALGATVKLKLFTAGPSPINPLSVVADFTEATFNGYVEVTIADSDWAGPANSQNLNALVIYDNVQFVAAAISGAGETIIGYYIVDSAETGLLYAEEFDEPWEVVQLGDLLDLLVMVPVLMVGSLQ